METKLKQFNYFNKYFKCVESKSIEGYFPDSRAYFICEMLDQETIFIHGGCNKKGDCSQIYFFDFLNKEWKMIQEISTVDPFFIFDKKLSGHTSNIVYHKGKRNIIVYGGFDGKFYSNAIYLIEIENFQFQQVDMRGDKNSNNTTEYPLPRCYHSSNYDHIENCIYIFGGWNANVNTLMTKNFMSLWKFDVNGNFLNLIKYI
jgi:hypothetical protein